MDNAAIAADTDIGKLDLGAVEEGRNAPYFKAFIEKHCIPSQYQQAK